MQILAEFDNDVYGDYCTIIIVVAIVVYLHQVGSVFITVFVC